MKFISQTGALRAKFAAVLMSLTLAACSVPPSQEDVTLKFSGKSTTTGKTVSGSAMGAPFGSGEFALTVSDGRVCEGFYQHISREMGQGLVTCQDGSVGTFAFTSTGRAGGGSADLEGEKFTFKFALV